MTFGMSVQLACDVTEDLAAYDLAVLFLLRLHGLHSGCRQPPARWAVTVRVSVRCTIALQLLTSRNLRSTSLASLSSTVGLGPVVMRDAAPQLQQ
jgi:hypothetical protein